VSALRPYQFKAVTDVRAALETHHSVVLQMPTGSGKTFTGVEIARERLGVGPVWFLCHRKELIKQAMRTFKRAGIDFGVIAPWAKREPGKLMQIGSVDTLRNHDAEFPKPKTVMWDECHRAAAKTWAALMRRHPQAAHVGLTATPERLDGKGLDDLFEALVVGPSVADLIDAGHLSRFRWFAPTEPDLTAARMSKGDYRADDLDKAMNRPVLIGDAIEHYQRIAPGTRAIVFCPSVAMSENVAARFQEAGISAAHVSGNSPDAERDLLVADFAAGRIKVLVNVDLFIEGFDVPGIETVILLRPTRSLRVFLQMVGRGLRLDAGKTIVTVLDHAGMCMEHGFPDATFEWSLEGGARTRRIENARKAGEVIRRCPKCGCAHPISAICPECGYEYPAGREPGRFDGALHEIRCGAAKPMTVSGFAKECGVVKATIHNWISRGMPHPNAGAGAAIDWIERNVDADRIRQLNATLKNSKETGETLTRFSNSRGIGIGSIIRWRKCGMPDPTRDHAEADAWIKNNVDRDSLRKRSRAKRDANKFSTSLTEFAKKNHVSTSTICGWMARGMPDPRIDDAGSGKWIIENISVERVYLLSSALDISKKTQKTLCSFARRLNVSEATVYNLRKRGMPDPRMNEAGAEQWVRDNTKIVIPESAWEGVPDEDATPQGGANTNTEQDGEAA